MLPRLQRGPDGRHLFFQPALRMARVQRTVRGFVNRIGPFLQHFQPAPCSRNACDMIYCGQELEHDLQVALGVFQNLAERKRNQVFECRPFRNQHETGVIGSVGARHASPCAVGQQYGQMLDAC